MFTRLLARTRSWLATGLALGVVVPLVVATPGWAQEVEPPDEELPLVECPAFAGEPAAEDEFTAYQYALACGVNVEVTGLRDVDREAYATPEGLLDAQVAVQPYQVRDASGEWVPIDPTLISQADGSAAAAATVIDVVAGAGGDAPFVTATDPDGGSLSLSWPGGGLPAPVLEGAVATYPEVLPGVDLAVQAEPVGFSWVLVVKSAEAAADPALSQIEVGIDTVGLTVVETGTGLEVVDADGEVVFEAGQAIMWDSSEPGTAQPSGFGVQSESEEPAGDPGRIGEVEVEVTSSGIGLVPDAEMLADESLTYPVYIDPPFTSSRKAWANVYASRKSKGWTGDSSWPRSGGMRVGRNTWPTCGDGCGLWRSVIRLNIGKLKGKYIHSARVHALQTHTGGCGSYGLQLWRTKAITNGVSWNGVSWLYGQQLDTKTPPSSNTDNCGSGHSNEWVRFDSNVKKRVQSAADKRYNTISFGLRSKDESSRNAWRRIRTSSVKLHVTYYIYPPKPDRRKLNGQGCKTSLSSADWVTSRHPTMSVRARSQESESVYVRLRVRKRGASSNYYWWRTPDPVGAYSTVNRRITKSLPDGEYTWQARTDSRHTSAVNSGYTSLCYFKVDATKPTTPTVSAPAGPFTEGQNVALSVSSTDPLVNGFRSGLNRYEYSWNTPTYGGKKTSSGSATITRSNAPAGRQVLYVRAVDNAGNISNERTYTFFVGRDIPATPMGMWRFEGDLFDDSSHGNDLSLRTGSGPLFGADDDGRADAALELDGSTCLRGQAPVRTDAAFSVAMWVRMDAKPESYSKVLAQGGATSAYQFQYSTAADQWIFSVLSEDYQWHSLGAANPVGLGAWLHVAGTYDPDAGITRIYLNGSLAGERSVDFEPWNSMDFFSVGCLRTGHQLTGAIDGLGTWQGLLSPTQIRAAMKELPGAVELARWEFRNGGEDSSRYGRDLDIPDHVVAGEDPYHRPNGTIELDGETCLQYPEPIARIDRSWSVSAWVKVDEVAGEASLVSTYTDEWDSGFKLSVRPRASSASGYGLALAHFYNDEGGTTKPKFVNDVELGHWYHVAISYKPYDGGYSGEFEAASKQYYVNGELKGTMFLSPHMIGPGGPLLIGCANHQLADGSVTRAHYLDGSLHDVRLWRGFIDSADVAAMVGNPPAELGGRWRLEGTGDTSGNGHGLTFEGDTQIWDGWSCDPDSALALTGAGSAATDGPVVATDESFTVSAWGRIDSLAEPVTFVSAAGQQQTGFRLQYHPTNQQFQFVTASGDVPSTADGFKWSTIRGGPTPEADTWYHLVGVFDLKAGEIRLYVNGELVATGAGPDSPWYADGPLVLGASATADGNRWNMLQGAVDDVVAWQGIVPDHVIAQMSPGVPVGMC